jgi:DNA-directed RNA polymerase subunit RPC12/RpoP
MSAVAYKFKCDACGAEFEAPEVPEMSYGQFVMRSKGSDDSAYLDAQCERVFLESYEIVKRHPRLARLAADQRAKVQQAVFAVTCDKAPHGESLEIGLSPKCPSCGLQKPKSWHQIFPVREWVLPSIKHETWNMMDAAAKAHAIDVAIQHFFDENKDRHDFQ